MQQLDGRTAVVTGGARGIGRGLAEVLGRQGMRVVVADIDGDHAVATASELVETGIDAWGTDVDVTDDASVAALVTTVVERCGGLHVLCNNAGVAGRFGRTWATPLAEWQWVFDVNVFGIVRCLEAFLPLLLEQDEAHVVNTGSAACFEALPAFGPYASSKHAVLGISEALKRELAAQGAPIGVTVLFPAGIVKSGIMDRERFGGALAGLADADDAPVSTLVRSMFAAGVAAGSDPVACAAAVVDAIKEDRFVACEQPADLEAWGRHAAALAAGTVPGWP